MEKNIITLIDKVKHIEEYDFNEVALEIFQFQYHNLDTYREFCDYLNVKVANVNRIEDIPFLPVEFFKTRKIIAKGYSESHIFQSSTTTGNIPSSHYVGDISLYEHAILHTFNNNFGLCGDFHFVALLPGYVERKNASLVYMVDYLMQSSGMETRPFFLHEYKKSLDYIHNYSEDKQIVLWGVTHALLQLCEYNTHLNNVIIIETGGMKGMGKELTREELYHTLNEKLNPKALHSEYGMTELLSHAYSTDGQWYRPASTMRVVLRDLYSPMRIIGEGRGGINVVDLCNVLSCSFIATQDIGIIHHNTTFSVLGRIDNSELRGCNLMAL